MPSNPHPFIAAVLLTLATPALAADAVSRIAVEGNARIEAESIRSRLTLAEGKLYTPALAQSSLEALNATGQFRDVRIERRGQDLAVVVSENPTLAAIAYTGQSGLEKSLIEPEVKLRIGDPITPAKAHAAAVRIRDLYRAKGRVATIVDPALDAQSNNRVSLTFRITEGAVMKVASISFTGNQAFPSAKLRDVTASSESNWLDILKTSSTYDAARLELDRELVLIHYRKNGYPDAKVTLAEPKENAAHTGYDVSFVIDEGDRYTFAAHAIETAVQGVDSAVLDQLVATQPGAVYNAEHVERSVQAIATSLANAGNLTAHVTTMSRRDNVRHTLTPVFRIKDGAHVTIERVNIHGNVKTKDHVIRRAVKQAEGEYLNQVRADADKRRLQKLGLFKTVAVKAMPGSTPDRAVLDVEVVEQDTIELAYGAGYSSTEGIIGDVQIADTNLFGNGQNLRLKISGSQTRLQAEVGFTEPSLFDSRYSGGFDLLYRDTDNSRISSFKSTKAGGDVRLGTALSDNLSVSTNYTLTRNQIYDVGPLASAAIKEAASLGNTPGTYDTSSIGTTTTYDTRDKRTLANSGAFFTTSQDFAGLGGDARFIRNTAEGRLYYPITDQITLVGRATAGNITGWGGQDVRLLDMFNKGGETVRGFAAGGIGPRDLLSANQDALGGTSYVSTSAEARFALPFVPDSVGLKGAVFADAGSLFGTSKSAAGLPGIAGANAQMRASVGTGLIWDSPLGPLGVTYAVPLLKQPFDKTQPLNFGLVGY